MMSDYYCSEAFEIQKPEKEEDHFFEQYMVPIEVASFSFLVDYSFWKQDGLFHF